MNKNIELSNLSINAWLVIGLWAICIISLAIMYGYPGKPADIVSVYLVAQMVPSTFFFAHPRPYAVFDPSPHIDAAFFTLFRLSGVYHVLLLVSIAAFTLLTRDVIKNRKTHAMVMIIAVIFAITTLVLSLITVVGDSNIEACGAVWSCGNVISR